MPLEDLGLLFFTVLILSLLLTPMSIRFSHLVGAIDHPIGRSMHLNAMPRLGGIGMVLAMLIGIALFLQFNAITTAFITGILIILATGVADDIHCISPKIKLLGQIIACVSFIELSGFTITSVGDIFALGEITFSGPFAYVITLLTMLTIINAFNLSDGLDGLAAGIIAIACLFLGMHALGAEAWLGFALIITLMGAVLGFLKFNSHPAKLFMGDTGSLMLGFSIIAISLILINSEPGEIRPVSIFAVLAMPILDLFWVMTSRIMQGKSPVNADKTHLHHRLIAIGLPHSAVVSVLYTWVIILGLLGIVDDNVPEYLQLLSIFLLTGLFYFILTLFERKKIRIPFNATTINQNLNINNLTTRLLGRSMRILPYVIIAGLSLPILTCSVIPESFGKLAMAMFFFVAVAFPWRDYHERLNSVYAILYLCGFFTLFVWNVSTYNSFDPSNYTYIFSLILLIWAFLKIKFKSHHEVFLTSSFELLLIFISWFIPYAILPALEVPDSILYAAKLACLGAIPLLIAMKLIIKAQPHRNLKFSIGIMLILCLISIKSLW